MINKNKIAFILEGEKREKHYFTELIKLEIFPKEIEIILLSAKFNLYTLWQELNKDENLDVIEIINEKNKNQNKLNRNDFSEIYLFFDYDPQQRNLPKGYDFKDVIKKMLETFNNETENGKLYISYPMIEALRDIKENTCCSFYKCYIPKEKLSSYKEKTGNKNVYNNIKKYTKETLEMIMAIFLVRCNCLFNKQLHLTEILSWYKKEEISPLMILEKELELYNKNKNIFILSAIPEFLIGVYPIIIN